jgi:hypothetical protein
VARSHQKVVYGLLMRAAAQALLSLAADSRYLGARPGILAVLHTWTRALLFHSHVHLLVTAGGVTPDGTTWRMPRNGGFLVPCRPLSVLFRAKFRDALGRHGLLNEVRRKAWRKKWVVHALHAGGGHPVLEYLGRYVYRVAISNSRIERFEDGVVTFRYPDHHSGQWRHCSLAAEGFIPRFLQHVLPRGFSKVRSCGLFSPTSRPALEWTRRLLHEHPAAAIIAGHRFPNSRTSPNVLRTEPRCPLCKLGTLLVVTTLPRMATPASNIRGPP